MIPLDWRARAAQTCVGLNGKAINYVHCASEPDPFDQCKLFLKLPIHPTQSRRFAHLSLVDWDIDQPHCRKWNRVWCPGQDCASKTGLRYDDDRRCELPVFLNCNVV